MPACSLQIPAESEQVRVARLVATAAARRCGLHEEDIDDVRLAVGEAVGRAVIRQHRTHPDLPVTVHIAEDDALFTVEVHDDAVVDTDDDARMATAIITGLVPSAQFAAGAHGGQVVRLAWARPDSQVPVRGT